MTMNNVWLQQKNQILQYLTLILYKGPNNQDALQFFMNKDIRILLIQYQYKVMLISKLAISYRNKLFNNHHFIQLFITNHNHQNFSQRKQAKASLNPDGQYYEKLEIKRQAKLNQIKKGYYQLSRKYHPDINKSRQSAQKFNGIRQAYQILSNADLRAEYDQLLKQKQSSTNTQDNTNANIHTNTNRQQQYSKSGPYQTEQQYASNAGKSYYNLTKAEWNQTRRGLNQQSFTSIHSAHARSIGVNSDDDIGHFQRKTIFLNGKGVEEEKEQQLSEKEKQEKMAKYMEKKRVDLERHRERVRLVKQQNQYKSWLEGIKSIFSSQNQKNESK